MYTTHHCSLGRVTTIFALVSRVLCYHLPLWTLRSGVLVLGPILAEWWNDQPQNWQLTKDSKEKDYLWLRTNFLKLWRETVLDSYLTFIDSRYIKAYSYWGPWTLNSLIWLGLVRINDQVQIKNPKIIHHSLHQRVAYNRLYEHPCLILADYVLHLSHFFYSIFIKKCMSTMFHIELFGVHNLQTVQEWICLDEIEHSLDHLSLLWYLISVPNPFKSSFSNFHFCREMTTSIGKNDAKYSESNFSKSFSCRKEFELEEYYLHSRQKKCQSEVSNFSNCIKSILFFSSKGSDGLFCNCNSMLNFVLFRLQIVFKAAQKQDYNIIHLQRLKLQTVCNRNSFYGLSTVTEGVWWSVWLESIKERPVQSSSRPVWIMYDPNIFRHSLDQRVNGYRLSRRWGMVSKMFLRNPSVKN